MQSNRDSLIRNGNHPFHKEPPDVIDRKGHVSLDLVAFGIPVELLDRLQYPAFCGMLLRDVM